MSPRARDVPRSRSQGTGRRLVKAHSVMEEPPFFSGPHLRVRRQRQCKSFGTEPTEPRRGCDAP